MKRIIDIGKEGNQNFKIPKGASDVSRHHAKVTIEDGVWRLEDNNSTNGTYIQDENGHFVRIKNVIIDEFTRIALGSTSAMGITFVAHHLVEDDPANFCIEMKHVVEEYSKFQQAREQLEADTQKRLLIRNIPPIISATIGVIMFIILPKLRLATIVVMSLITSLLGGIINTKQTKDTRLKILFKKQQRIIRCPNPFCNRSLSESDIERQRCPYCKVHS